MFQESAWRVVINPQIQLPNRVPAQCRGQQSVTGYSGSGKSLRIAIYAHDSLGLGHTRRNLLVAQALAQQDPSVSILLISGAIETRTFQLPPGVDCLSLPALHKDDDGVYAAKRLGFSFGELTTLRSAIIRAALNNFQPDVLIVDNVPHGSGGELLPALSDIRERPNSTCILGMREILDEPAAIEREWKRNGVDFVLRSFYDAIWIYGDPAVYDATRAYAHLRPVRHRARFTGYLDQRERPREPDPRIEDILLSVQSAGSRLVLCCVGGGQDGDSLARAFAHARLPGGAVGVLLTGPYLPESVNRELKDLSHRRDNLQVVNFIPEPAALIERADWIVGMGGYNSVCEILSYEKPALIVPRVRPRREQWMRATRLRDLGLVDVLNPDALSPEAISGWLSTTNPVSTNARSLLDFDGLRRIPMYMSELLQAAPSGHAADLRVSGD